MKEVNLWKIRARLESEKNEFLKIEYEMGVDQRWISEIWMRHKSRKKIEFMKIECEIRVEKNWIYEIWILDPSLKKVNFSKLNAARLIFSLFMLDQN